MPSKRIIELSFLALFALGVGIALVIHQTYDEWLTQLVQASGSKVAGGPLKLSGLKWQAAEQTLSLSAGAWYDQERAAQPWLRLPAARWQFSADAWQGAQFRTERLELVGLVAYIRQEGLTTNINRLIQQVDAMVITPEKVGRGKEPLVFNIDQVVVRDLQVELSTLKHGVLRWSVPELRLALTADTHALAFDALLQQFTRSLLAELKTQATQHLLTLSDSNNSPEAGPTLEHH